jgi:hypothetical protein
VPLPCGSTVQSVCGPCARKAKALPMAQCREGWHLTEEPTLDADEPTEQQQAQLTARADLLALYHDALTQGREEDAEELREDIRQADDTLRQLGVRGRLLSPDPPLKRPAKRSTRRRQDAPNLPTCTISKTTLGREYAGRFWPSMFVTLTCPVTGGCIRTAPRWTPSLMTIGGQRGMRCFCVAGGSVVAEPAPCRGLGSPVLRHRRTPKTRGTAPPHRAARLDPARGDPPGHRGHLPPSLVAPTTTTCGSEPAD